MLFLLLVLVGTLMALLLGIDETTVGTAAKAAEVPTTKKASSNAVYPISCLQSIFKLFISFPFYLSPQGTGGWPIACGCDPDALCQRFAVDLFTTMTNPQSGFSNSKSDQPALMPFVDEALSAFL